MDYVSSLLQIKHVLFSVNFDHLQNGYRRIHYSEIYDLNISAVLETFILTLNQTPVRNLFYVFCCSVRLHATSEFKKGWSLHPFGGYSNRATWFTRSFLRSSLLSLRTADSEFFFKSLNLMFLKLLLFSFSYFQILYVLWLL